MLFLYLTYQLNLHKHPGLLFLMDFSFESCSQVFPKLTLRYRDFRMSPNSHTCISFLIISISNESSVLVIVAKAMLPHHYQSPQLTLGFTLGGVPYMCLDKCIMTFIHHYSIIQDSFTVLHDPHPPPIHPSLPLSESLANPDLSTVSIVLSFQNVRHVNESPWK